MTGKNNSSCTRFFLLIGFFLATLLVAPWLGSTPVGVKDIWQSLHGQVNDVSYIFWSLRLPRVLMGGLTGMGLALSGLVLQALLRNHLADPYTLGIGSGSALGAVLAIALGVGSHFYFLSTVSLMAFLGALLSMMIVLGLSRGLSGLESARIILTGITLQFFFSSVVLILHYLASLFQSQQILHWLIGGIDIDGYEVFAQIAPFYLIGLCLLFPLRDDLNLLLVGEEYAHSRGVNVKSIKTRVFLGASLLTGSIISVVGPIGFVGLMSPHLAKFLMGWDHRRGYWATMMIGALLVIWCDVVCRVLIFPLELPVGAMTSLIGGPYMIFLLYRRQRGRGLM